jgi:hypothetical protein
MKSNYFHKSCNKTSRRFFEDFDLLPTEVKRLLSFGPTCPTFEDLREAWKLAGETFSLDKVLEQLNIFEEERKQKKVEEARIQKEKKKEERAKARWEAYRKKYYGDQVYTRIVVRRKKDERLIQKVSEETAVKMLSERKENKDVKIIPEVTVYDVYAGHKKKQEKELKFMEFSPVKNSLGKQMHNS